LDHVVRAKEPNLHGNELGLAATGVNLDRVTTLKKCHESGYGDCHDVFDRVRITCNQEQAGHSQENQGCQFVCYRFTSSN